MTPQVKSPFLFSILLALAAVVSLHAQSTFAPRFDYAIPGPSRPAFADFDGDGRIDMIAISTVLNPAGSGPDINNMYFFRGVPTGAGTFGLPVITPADPSVNPSVGDPGQLYAADFDKDGKMDLLAVAGNSILFLKGNGNGTFQPAALASTGGLNASRVIITDLDNDGNLDLVFGSRMSVRYGNGNGTFRVAPTLFALCTDATYRSVAVTYLLADLNGDGRPDAVTGCSGSGAAVAYRNTDGSFGSPVALTAFGGHVTVNDFNGDGINDVIVLGNQQALLLGAPNGTLLAPAIVAAPPNPTGALVPYFSIVSADFNFDGRNDLLCNTATSVEIYPGSTPGTFSPLISIALPGYIGRLSVYHIELTDLNRDGGPDLYIWNQATGAISIYLTQPPSVFLSSSANPVITGSPVTLTANVAAQAAGVFYTNLGSVTFYSGSNPLGSAVNLVNGAATVTTSALPQGLNFIRAVYQLAPTAPLVYSALVTVAVTANACGSQTTGALAVPGGFRLDRTTNQFVQDVDILNTSNAPVDGPISLMVAGLSPNATLAAPYARTACNSPGTPVVDAGICPNGQLGVGQSMRVTLRFNNPSRAAISYTPRIIAGMGRR